MVRNNHFQVIRIWFENTNQVQARKYYSSQELYGIFIEEFQSSLQNTERSFSYRLNQLVEMIGTLHKVEIKTRDFRYIILNGDDSANFSQRIRISQRKRKPPPINRIVSQAYPNHIQYISPHKQTQTQTCNDETIDTDEQETESNIANQILNMSKSDSPMALSFFFWQRQSKKNTRK